MRAFIGLAFIAAAAVSLSISVASWRRRPAPGAFGLALLCFAHFGWSATYALQWLFTSHEPSLTWYLVRLMWLQATPTAIVVFVLDFAGWKRWLNRRTVALLLVQPVAVLLIAATDSWHGLYLAGNPPGLLVTSGGPVFALNALYSYALMTFAAVLLSTRLKRRYPYRSQTAVMMLAIMLPVAYFLLQMGGLRLSTEVNTVPFTFTIAGAIKWFALTRLGLFRVLPVARDQLIEQLPDGLVVFDANRLIVDINPAAIALTGARTPCIGKTADEAFPEQAETIAALRAGLLVSERASVRGPTHDGGVMEATASGVVDRDGHRIATLVTLRDITAEVRAHSELAARSEELAAALERSERILAAMTDGVLLVDASATVVRDNPAARRILGTGSRTLGGESLGALLPDIDGGALVDLARASAEPVTTSLTMPDGRAIVLVVIPLLEAAFGGAQTLLVVRDETARVAAERMQREFVANVSHELQTPLTGLSLLATTIARAMRDDPTSVDGFIERLGAETERLTGLTRGLMMLSRAESAGATELFSTVDLSRAVIEETRAHEPSAEAKGQSLSTDVHPDVYVAGDEIALRAIVDNLVGNAIRYTQEGGGIRVRLEEEADADAERWAVLEVEDDGPGIPLEHQARIFERFYRMDKARSSQMGGSGLGLSIVRQAAERHGGSVELVSAPGRGARFIVRIPAEPSSPPPKERSART